MIDVLERRLRFVRPVISHKDGEPPIPRADPPERLNSLYSSHRVSKSWLCRFTMRLILLENMRDRPFFVFSVLIPFPLPSDIWIPNMVCIPLRRRPDSCIPPPQRMDLMLRESDGAGFHRSHISRYTQFGLEESFPRLRPSRRAANILFPLLVDSVGSALLCLTIPPSLA